MCVLRAARRASPACFRFVSQAVEAAGSLEQILPSPKTSMTWLHTPPEPRDLVLRVSDGVVSSKCEGTLEVMGWRLSPQAE